MGDLQRPVETALDVAIFGAVMLPACVLAWAAVVVGRGVRLAGRAMACPVEREETRGAQSF